MVGYKQRRIWFFPKTKVSVHNKENKTILVIDDEPVIGSIIKRFMGNNGYSVHFCASSEEAISASKNTVPELIISDFNLPCCSNGIDLCLKIQQSTRQHVPVIIISGENKNELNAKKRGFAFMGKPLEKEKFLPLVEECLS